MKKLLSLFITLTLVVSMALSMSVTSFAAEKDDVWKVNWKGVCGEFSVDTNTYYKNSRYSIKVSNPTDYNCSEVVKYVETKPNTTYRFSAWIKYSGYKLDPKAERDESGAYIKVFSRLNNVRYRQGESVTVNKNKWTKVELTFTTSMHEDEKYYLMLGNGFGYAGCKGKAWFSDIKLEKDKTTNKWNILTVIFKNIDTKVNLNGKNTTVKSAGKGLTRFKDSLSSEEVSSIKKTTNRLYDSLCDMSGGLVDVKDIDFVVVDEPLTSLQDKDDGFCVNYDDELVKKYIDKYLAKKKYQQIIIVSPVDKISGGWVGLGGIDYKGLVKICQLCEGDFTSLHRDFPESCWVHEILHGVERDSMVLNPDATAGLHDADTVYGYECGAEWKEWYSDYMRCKTPDGKGVVPEAFYRPSGKYTLVDGDMSVGEGITIPENSRIDISNCKVAKISDKTYSGKKKIPTPIVTDGKYTLKKGVDYTVTYSNNKNVGKAKITITGKGVYKGTLTAEFNIVKKK